MCTITSLYSFNPTFFNIASTDDPYITRNWRYSSLFLLNISFRSYHHEFPGCLALKYCITINFKFKPWVGLHSFQQKHLEMLNYHLQFPSVIYCSCQTEMVCLKGNTKLKASNKESLKCFIYKSLFFPPSNFVYCLKYITLQNRQLACGYSAVVHLLNSRMGEVGGGNWHFFNPLWTEE